MLSSPELSLSGQSKNSVSKSGILSPEVSQSNQKKDSDSKTSVMSPAKIISEQSNYSVSNHSVKPASVMRQSKVSDHSVSINKQNESFKRASSVVSSIYRHVSLTVENRDKEEFLKNLLLEEVFRQTLPEAQQNGHLCLYPHAHATDPLTNLAREFVNDLIIDAFKKINEESIEEVKAKMYPKTKAAKDTQPSVFEMGTSFVNRILSEAKKRVDQINLLGVERFAKYSSVEEFKVNDGLEIVARCISNWSFNPHWYFKIVYNGRSVSDSYSYYYTVRWSAPSLSYPVAQVTADVYFVIEVFPMTPPPVFIKVSFRLETDRSTRCALRSKFLEKWLHTVIRRKLQMFQMLTF